MLTKKVLVESTMVDSHRKLKLPSIFGLFQDVATADAEAIGYGHDVTSDVGKLWVFTRVYIEIKAYPDYLSQTNITTYPNPSRGFAFPRQAVFKDNEGNEQLRISSLWALIDAQSRRLIFHPGLPEVETCQKEGELEQPGRIATDNATFRYSRHIRNSDIDLNGHLNNTRYVEMIVDIHPSSYYLEHPISSLLIHYETEVAEGETIDIYCNEKATYIRGQCDDRICFEANLTYR